MATVDHQQRLGRGGPKTPDSLPIGSDVMDWGQGVVRYLLPDRTRIDAALVDLGYRNPKVINVIGGLLDNVNGNPRLKEPNLWRYLPKGTDTGMEAKLYASSGDVIILTTTPQKTANWEFQVDRHADPGAAAEYGALYGEERPGYKYKMVMFDPGTEDQQVGLDRFVVATQADRKLPLFGLRPQDWGFKGFAARWAILYEASTVGDTDVLIKLSHPDGSQTAELYRYSQREAGKVHVAARLVNVEKK